jgi:hypothetical protein
MHFYSGSNLESVSRDESTSGFGLKAEPSVSVVKHAKLQAVLAKRNNQFLGRWELSIFHQRGVRTG